MSSLLKSPQGDVSSKRVAGWFLIIAGVAGSFYGAIAKNQMLVDVCRGYVITGASLTGIGVVEHFAPGNTDE